MTGQAVNTWDVFTGSPAVPPSALAELAALRATLPGYDVTITATARPTGSRPPAATPTQVPGA